MAYDQDKKEAGGEVNPYRLIYGENHETSTVMDRLPKINLLSYNWFSFVCSAIVHPIAFQQCRVMARRAHIKAICDVFSLISQSIDSGTIPAATINQARDILHTSPDFYPLKSRILLFPQSESIGRDIFEAYYKYPLLVKTQRAQKNPKIADNPDVIASLVRLEQWIENV